jgi:hypothetical protein
MEKLCRTGRGAGFDGICTDFLPEKRSFSKGAEEWWEANLVTGGPPSDLTLIATCGSQLGSGVCILGNLIRP